VVVTDMNSSGNRHEPQVGSKTDLSRGALEIIKPTMVPSSRHLASYSFIKSTLSSKLSIDHKNIISAPVSSILTGAPGTKEVSFIFSKGRYIRYKLNKISIGVTYFVAGLISFGQHTVSSIVCILSSSAQNNACHIHQFASSNRSSKYM
jgi:hypothetical protein